MTRSSCALALRCAECGTTISPDGWIEVEARMMCWPCWRETKAPLCAPAPKGRGKKDEAEPRGPDDSTLKLVEHYCVEDGELKNRTPDQAFVLGAEWGRATERILAGQAFTMQVSHQNQRRLQSVAVQNGRDIRFLPLDPDWIMLKMVIS